MKSSRQQFEERFPTPPGVRWDESNQCYVCKFVSPYLALWMGWKASREALIADLQKIGWAPCVLKTPCTEILSNGN